MRPFTLLCTCFVNYSVLMLSVAGSEQRIVLTADTLFLRARYANCC